MAGEFQADKASMATKAEAQVHAAGGAKTVNEAAAKKPRISEADDDFIEAGNVAPLSASEQRGCRILRFGPNCTMHEAPALRTALLYELDQRKPMLLDAAAIESIDTAGVQMLVDLAIECMERSLAFQWKERSLAVEHAVATLGVAALMESPGSVDQFKGLV